MHTHGAASLVGGATAVSTPSEPRFFDLFFSPELGGSGPSSTFSSPELAGSDFPSAELGGSGGSGASSDLFSTFYSSELGGSGGSGASSGIFSTVEARAKGNAGDIKIQSRSLSLTGGAEVQSLTRGEGNAGNIRVNVTESIKISGVTAPLLIKSFAESGFEDVLLGGFSSGLIRSFV